MRPRFQVPADDGEGFPGEAGQRFCVPAIVENILCLPNAVADQCMLANYFFAGMPSLVAGHRYFLYNFAHTGRPRQDVGSSKINALRNWVRKGYLTKQGSWKVQLVPFIVLSQEIYVDFLPRVRLKSCARNRILTNFKMRGLNKLEMEIKPRVELKKGGSALLIIYNPPTTPLTDYFMPPPFTVMENKCGVGRQFVIKKTFCTKSDLNQSSSYFTRTDQIMSLKKSDKLVQKLHIMLLEQARANCNLGLLIVMHSDHARPDCNPNLLNVMHSEHARPN